MSMNARAEDITLITGATGRVGSELVRALTDRGSRVRALVLPDDANTQGLVSQGVEIRRGKLEEMRDVRECVDGVVAIVHLASVMSWAAEDEDAIFEGNVRGTYNLLRAASEAMPTIKSVVIASSDDTYPSLLGGGEPLEETRPLAPLNPYALSKELSERIGLFRWRSQRLPVSVVRFSAVAAVEEALSSTGWSGRFLFAGGWLDYFKASGNEEAAALVAQAAEGDREVPVVLRGSDGEPYVLHIADVRDICEGLMLMLDQPSQAAGEIFNLAGPAPFALDEAAAALREHGGFAPREVIIPGARIAICLDIGKARSVLGYRPRWTISKIIADAVARRALASE